MITREELLKQRAKLVEQHAQMRDAVLQLEGAIRLADMLLTPVPDGSAQPQSAAP